MAKNYLKASCFALSLLLSSCSGQSLINKNTSTTSKKNVLKTSKSRIWNFNDLNDWKDATQAGEPNYSIKDGKLYIFTNPNTWERVKIKSTTAFATGSYTWRVYAPAMGKGDMTCIAAFLYHNDHHELDFEIAYGNQADRKKLNAASNELIVYMTSQGNPKFSFQSKLIRENWYNLTLELALNENKKYVATWKIDNVAFTSTVLNYGSRTKFKILCSVENLSFAGDHIPYQQNYALFDSVTFNEN
ncbi:hypothetical protein AAGV33_02820 [Flavobacterium sp. FBOR7N2.3]|uniref:Polysaccharide lyase family 7 protein n=1 Tax=Flavobacterium magnesitis TaxID=3138077 RepID=A0ABV4TJN6_9FLAO